jgi:hypothetical protein
MIWRKNFPAVGAALSISRDRVGSMVQALLNRSRLYRGRGAEMSDVLDSDWLANLVLFFAIGATGLGSLMMFTGLAMRRRLSPPRGRDTCG